MRQRDLAAGRLRRAPLDQRFSESWRVVVVEADVEARPRFAGNEVDGLVADIDRGEFQVRRLEMRAAVVERLGHAARAISVDEAAHRIVGALADRRRGPACRSTISVPLSEPRRPILIMSPSVVGVARLAQNAVVEFLAALGRPFQQLRRCR